MRKWILRLTFLLVVVFGISAVHFQSQVENVLLPTAGGVDPARVMVDRDYGRMPLAFIPNKGQMDKQVYYYLQGKDKSVYFTSTGLTYSLAGPVESKPGAGDKSKPRSFEEQRERELSQPSKRWVVKLDFVGARKDVKPESLEKSGAVVSYFKGKKKDWQTGLEAASKIIYRDLWPGIDLLYYGTVNKMKYEFIVHPGADPSRIKLAYRGAESVEENSQGQLEVQTPTGGFIDDTPMAYQEIAGKCEPVALTYALENKHTSKRQEAYTYGFFVGAYDKTQPLILDPAVLVYCGYIGGLGDDVSFTNIVVDEEGCVYVTGSTSSNQSTFPVKSGPDLTYNGSTELDAFVAKVESDGTGLVYCGYIGGADIDSGHGIAVDASGCAYVTGRTASDQTTFPVTVGPDLTHNGFYDAFVAKINANGTALDYCGYIGGCSREEGTEIAIDASGCAYLTGSAWSDHNTFPVTVGPDLAYNGGGSDAFVAKVNAAGTGLIYCGYIGGSNWDDAYSIAVDGSGCTYVTGGTGSDQATFPVTVGPYLTFLAGDYDAYVAKVNTAGTGLIYCGYIGGSGSDYGRGITVDGSGCAYVTGATGSDQATFPVTVGPDLTYNGGNYDAFLAKVNVSGTAFDYCGYIGGAGDDFGTEIVLDSLGCAYLNGRSSSDQTTFPVTVGPDLTYNGEIDAFVAKINAVGTALDYCGYIGGSSYDEGYGIAVDTSGFVYVAGNTYSAESTFPVTVGPDLTFNGYVDVFVAKITLTNPPYTVNFAAGNGGSLTGITSQTIDYGGNCTAVESVANDGYEFVNWTGTGGFVTTTDNPLTVTNVTADMMITANFAHSNPAGWIPLEDFQNNMIVYGKAYNGNNPAATGDWLGAFGPGGTSDCRGIAAVQANGNYYITIGSNEISGETITFQLWPLPSGPSIDGSESITFIENGVYDGLPLHFGPRGQNFALVNGWNWVSFNTLPADTSFNAVFKTPGVIEQVKSQTQAAIYSGGSWIGDLTGMSGIAGGLMYKVKTNQAYAFNVTGMTVPFNTPLSLITGWNWSAYLPPLSQPVAEAVNSIITPVSQVKSQTQSVIKIGSTLFGDLTQMEPNKGYLILMNQAGILQYPQGESTFPGLAAEKIVIQSKTVSWPMMKGNQYNMVVLGKVYFAGKVVNTDGYYLASIGPNGEKDGRSIGPVKTDGSYFATILGNTGGEIVKFKLLDSTINKTYDVAGSLVFRPDDLKTGLDLMARSVKVTAPAGGANMQMGTDCTIAWEAYELNNVKIELYKGGRSFNVIAPSVPAGTPAYSWAIPDRMPAGDDYQVKVTGIDAGVIAKDLSRAFSIKPAPFIALLSPNGGEVWKVKQSYDITWRSGGIDNVKIELYKGTELKTVISAGTPAVTGKYTWTIPANHPQGTNYKIRISGVDVGLNLVDTGDSPFSIK